MHELGLVEASVLVFVEDLNERHSPLVVVAHRVAYDSDHLVWTQHAVVVAAVHLNTSIPWARFSKLLKKILRRSQENLRKMTELTKILGKIYDNADFQNFLEKKLRKILSSFENRAHGPYQSVEIENFLTSWPGGLESTRSSL